MPPISGPTIAAALVQPDHCPMAFDCAGPENDEMIMASELGTRSAPAIPCSAREITNTSPVHASPHITEVTAKPASPHSRILALPKWSESEPATRINAPSVSR